MSIDTELAWAAGFFDGEGTTCVGYDGPRVSLQLTVAQVERGPLERFKEALGVGRVSRPYVARSPLSRHHISRFRAYGAEAEEALRLLWPFLCEPKRAQALRSLVAYEIAPQFNGKPLTKTAQVRMCGNSVCPPVAAAVVRAQLEAA